MYYKHLISMLNHPLRNPSPITVSGVGTMPSPMTIYNGIHFYNKIIGFDLPWLFTHNQHIQHVILFHMNAF